MNNMQDCLVAFFRKIAHGDYEHRCWLRTEIEDFFGVNLPHDDICDVLAPSDDPDLK